MSSVQDQIDLLFAAELQFRLASAVRLATTTKRQPLDLPLEWTHGDTHVTYADVAIRADQADFAAWSLHHAATFLLAAATKNAILVAVPEPRNAPDPDIRSSYQIARLIRNAFAHTPFWPVWSIDADCRDTSFAVGNFINLNTTGLHGKPFDWRHYGGPLAILKLCHFVRFEVLKDTPPTARGVPPPKHIYYQQGDLILERISEPAKE